MRTYRTKHGTIATMNTANIGKAPSEEMTEVVNVAPSTIEVNTDEILIAFSSNLENFSDEQLEFIGQAFAESAPPATASLPPERVEKVLRLIVDK